MLRLNLKRTIGIMVGGLALAIAAGAHADPTDQQLISEAIQTREMFKNRDPGVAKFFEHSAGYVIFPGIGKGAVGIGGAHGNGVVFEKGRPVGRASVTQISIGAQVGGQEYAEVIFFETPAALARFMSGKFEFSGAVSAVALKSGASANAKYQDHVAVFTATKGGLMLEASLGGQKFSFEPFHTMHR
jgi:lipid-binding SYLF domain-containing protein